MDPRAELLLWTAIVWLIGVVGVLAARYAEDGRWLARLSASTVGAAGREVLVFLYCVTLPALFLITGLVSREMLGFPDAGGGLTFEDWARGAGLATVAAAFALVSLRLGVTRLGAILPPPGWALVRDAVYWEALWALLRAAPALWMGGPYEGVAVGAAADLGFLLALGRFAAPRTAETLGQLAVDLACLLVSGLIFFATRNLALCIAAHTVVRLAASLRIAPMPQSE